MRCSKIGVIALVTSLCAMSSASATDLKIPPCDFLSELSPDEFSIALGASSDEKIAPNFGKPIEKFTLADLDSVRKAYNHCNNQSKLNWANEYSIEYFNQRIDDAFLEVGKGLQQGEKLEEAKKYAKTIVERAKAAKSQGNYILNELRNELTEKKDKTSDTEEYMALVDAINEIDFIIEQNKVAASTQKSESEIAEASRYKGNDGLTPEQIATKERLSGPLMAQWGTAAFLIRLQDHCAPYATLLSDEDLESLIERQEGLWAQLAPPEELQAQIVEKTNREISAGLMNIRKRDCNAGNPDIQNLLTVIYATE